MAKFIITGDWHFRGTNPRARKDNFQEALTRKIYEVFNLAEAVGAKAIIVPGDLTDSPGMALGTIIELAAILQQSPCPVLAIHGNHDVWGANPGTKFRTPFGLLNKLHLIQDLGREAPFEDMDNDEFCITGHGFDFETDTPAGAVQYDPPQIGYQAPQFIPWNGAFIHVVHSMLMDHSPGFDMKHTLIHEVKTTAKVIISGHEHLGFGIVEREDGVLFINPGALCRLSAAAAEIERPIQVALLTVENDTAEAELIPIKCAQPGHEVLSREHLENEVEREARLERFLSLLAEEGEAKFLEIADIVEDIALRERIPGAVRDEALRRIGAAREALGTRTAS